MANPDLSAEQARDLRALAGFIIPRARAMTCRDRRRQDFCRYLRSLERDHDDICRALSDLAALAGDAFAGLEPERRVEVAAKFRETGGAPLTALVRVVMLCYYRDDRVMRSLGHEPRPPFPKGHVVEQGDWSLLDPGWARSPMWRGVDRT